MNKLCRACLTNVDSDVLTRNVLDIVQDPDDLSNSPNLFTRLTDIALDRSDDERLPQMLCQHCLDTFEMIKNFRLTCIQSNDWIVQQLWENKCFNRDLNIDDGHKNNEPVPIQTEIDYLDLAHLDRTLPSDDEHTSCADPPTTVHQKEPPSQHYECDLCAMLFYTRRHIEDHLRQHCVLEPVEFKKSLHQRHRGTTECTAVYRCSFVGCTQFFECLQSLKEHEERVHLGISLSTSHTHVSCDICGISISKAKLKAHKFEHTDVKTVECPMFNNKVNLHRQDRIVHKPHVCTFCNQSFAKRDTLKHHTMRHTGEKPQACKLCDFRCIQLVSLKNHMKRHTGEKPHVCEVCGRTFIQLVTLRVHMKTHTALPDSPKVATNYPCDQCQSVFAESTALRCHIRAVHLDAAAKALAKKFFCDKCELAFARNADLMQHRRIVHEGYKPFRCTVCERHFAKRDVLRKHMMRHTGERPHACQLCDRRFIQVVALKAHMNTHAKKGQDTQELSLFSCGKCDLVFKSKSSLQRHVRADHLGNNTFACPHCDLSFVKAQTRNDHVMRHTGERPYACQLCDRRFIKVDALKSHMRTHAKLGDTNAGASGIIAELVGGK